MRRERTPLLLVAVLSLVFVAAVPAGAATLTSGGRIGLATGSVKAPLPARLVLQRGGYHADDVFPGYRDEPAHPVTGTWSDDPSIRWTIPNDVAGYDTHVRIKDLGGLYRPQWIRDSYWYKGSIDAYLGKADTTLTVGAKLYRYYGQTRYSTNWEVAGEFFPGVHTGFTAWDGMFMSGAEDVDAPLVVATGEGYADALCASPLASAVGGRLVLTKRDALPPEIVKRPGTTPDGPFDTGLVDFTFTDAYYPVPHVRRTVYIVGGTSAVGKGVEDWFRSRGWGGGPAIVRLAGDDRYETAALVAAEVASATASERVKPVVVSGEGFADALGGSALASARKQPLLLVKRYSVPPSIQSFLSSKDATDSIVLGGDAVISNGVAATVKAAVRFDGDDRYDTCAQSVTYGLAKGWFKPYHMAIVTGADYPDGLAAGSALGRLGWPTLLARVDSLPKASEDVLRRNTVIRASVLGGRTVVSDPVASIVKRLLK